MKYRNVSYAQLPGIINTKPTNKKILSNLFKRIRQQCKDCKHAINMLIHDSILYKISRVKLLLSRQNKALTTTKSHAIAIDQEFQATS